MPETLTIGSLFSGYGGLDLAVEQVTGATPAWFVEYDTAPSKILAHHWPDVPNYGDVTTVDWATMPPVDILTGGYPCQPFSQAGRRKGTTDDRHLWPYVRQAIRHLRPRLVVLENVAGHRSLGFDRVLGDMAEDGLHVRWASLRASDIGAPHHRERLFIVAWQGSADTGHEPRWRRATDDGGAEGAGAHGIRVQRGDGDTPGEHHGPGENTPDPEDDGRDELHDSTVRNEARSGRLRDTTGGDRRETSTHPGSVGPEEGRQPVPGVEEVPGADYRIGALPPGRHAGPSDANGIGGRGEPVGVTERGQAANPHADGQGTRGAEPQRPGNADTGRQRRDGRGTAPEQEGRAHTPANRHSVGIDFGPYAPAVRRWERVTRPAPAPTELNTKGNPRLNAAFAEWMMGLPEGHVTSVPGISRSDQLKAIGNGVCPQQAYAALHQLLTSPATAGPFS